MFWVAGLIEGEGTLGLRTPARPFIEVSSVDEDIILRLQEWTGIGTVNQSRETCTGKRVWRWGVHRQEEAAGLLMTLWPLLGARRQTKAGEVLKAWRAAPLGRAKWTHCQAGHPLSGPNLRVDSDGRRRCRECINQRMRGYRAAKRS